VGGGLRLMVDVAADALDVDVDFVECRRRRGRMLFLRQAQAQAHERGVDDDLASEAMLSLCTRLLYVCS
jgi:hypothetical protein